MGNGDFGAVISGAPRDLCFTLGKSDVWDRRNDDRSHYPGTTFADVRQAFLDKDAEAYDRLLREMAARKPVDMPHLTTCGTLRLHLDEGLNPERLDMRVRLEDGTAVLTYNDRRIEAAVSREFDVLVITIDRGEGFPNADPHYDCYDKRLPFTQLPWGFSRPPLDENPAPEIVADQGRYYLTQRFRAGGGYTVGLAFAGFGVSEHAVLPNRIAGCLELPLGRHVQVYLTIASLADAPDPRVLCRERPNRAVAAGPSAIRDAHRRWWHAYWMQGLASVGDAAVEKWYYRSLYLCGSMLRAGKQSPGLQGVWCGENYPVWFADYHSNVNIQCIYWGLFTNNRLDMLEPFLRLYEGFAPHAREVARDYYQMRGLKFPHAGSIGGHELTAGAHSRLSTDPCETAWIAQMFWETFRYTQDLEFLKARAYPIIRDAALLLADYLVWDAARRCWIMPPMLHFESFAGEESGWDVNTLYGQAFFRMGFTQAIAAAERLGVDSDLRAEWREKLDRLAPIPTTEDGRWKAWDNRPDRYQGGDHSFMLPLAFPAGLVSAWHGPDEWREQARKTWTYLRDNAIRSCTGNAWCGGQGLAEIVRMGEVDLAFERARWVDQSLEGGTPENGFVVSDGKWHSFIQVDHSPGMCRVLADMLLLETGGVIRLFAGIPRNIPARFYSLRAPGGFLVTAEKRGEVVDYALVHATVQGTLRLANPWNAPWAVTDMATGVASAQGDAPVIEVTLAPGRDHFIAPQGVTPAAIPMETFCLSVHKEQE